MKRSIKAALISGLAFPGLGHIFLKKYLVGAVLLFAAGASVYSVSVTAIDTALSVAREIEAGEVSINEDAIGRLIEQKSQGSAKATNLSLVVLMLSWGIGVVDSYRVGKAKERTKGKVGERET
ncbi:MAG: hypothetical protein P8164_13405 [Gammaproteobacteria bacterium]|jgi:hypothetical protein